MSATNVSGRRSPPTLAGMAVVASTLSTVWEEDESDSSDTEFFSILSIGGSHFTKQNPALVSPLRMGEEAGVKRATSKSAMSPCRRIGLELAVEANLEEGAPRIVTPTSSVTEEAESPMKRMPELPVADLESNNFPEKEREDQEDEYWSTSQFEADDCARKMEWSQMSEALATLQKMIALEQRKANVANSNDRAITSKHGNDMEDGDGAPLELVHQQNANATSPDQIPRGKNERAGHRTIYRSRVVQTLVLLLLVSLILLCIGSRRLRQHQRSNAARPPPRFPSVAQTKQPATSSTPSLAPTSTSSWLRN